MSEMVHITFGRTVIAVRRDLALPNDPVLLRQLEAKLQEYRNRLNDPEMTAHREASTNYKIWVLQQLLDQGSLDFLLLKAAVAKDAANQTLAIAYLAYAWKVIENYCFNRGAQNRGGTGLPTGQVSPLYVPPDTSAAPFGNPEHTPPPSEERPMVAIPMETRGGRQRSSRIPVVDLPQFDPVLPDSGTLETELVEARRGTLTVGEDDGYSGATPAG